MRCEKDSGFSLRDSNLAVDVEVECYVQTAYGRTIKSTKMDTISPEIRKLAKLQLKDGMIIRREKPRAKIISHTIHGVTLHGGFRSQYSRAKVQEMFEAWFIETHGGSLTSRKQAVILWEKFLNATNQWRTQEKVCTAHPSEQSMSPKEYRLWKRRERRRKEREAKEREANEKN